MAQQPNGAEKPMNGAAGAYPGGAGAKWSFGLFDCFSPFGTCCLGCWCPCILYGKTQDRYKGDHDSSGINGSCCAFYALMCVGLPCILQCTNRGATRDRYGIEGSSFGDFCSTCWCGCCTLVQEEKEAIVRTTGMDPKTKQPYASPGQMTYP